MFTIGLRLATDFQRRRRLQPTLLEASLLDAMGSATRPSEEAEADELRSDLWQTVRESLGHEQAAALWLFYGEQQSVKEIASELGRSAVSVRVMLYRARKKLLPHLSDYDAGTSLGEDDKEEQVSVFGELAVGTES
jgi:RNA polymerase sigma factor (sigma-70 family)